LNNAGPDQLKMAFKLEDFGAWVAEKTGMPMELVRDDAEKQRVIEAGAQAAMAQQGQGAGQAANGQPPQLQVVQ